MGRFVIWVEDQYGHISRAFTWYGKANDGITKARAEATQRGIFGVDIWATPLANH